MPLPVIADITRVAFNWNGPNGLACTNVMHFDGDTGEEADLNSALVAHMQANMFNAISTSAVISSVDMIRLNGSAATVSFVAPATSLWKGETVGEALFADAVLIKWVSGFRGRDKRGRVYLPFPAEGAVVTGTVSAGALAAMQAAWDTWIAAMAGAGFHLVVASYKFATATLVSTLVVEGALGTQRRRQSRFRKAAGF